MNPSAVIDVQSIRDQIEDHEERVRRLERESATGRRLDDVEVRVRALEVSTARLWVICSGASFIASALASTLVALAAKAVAG